MPLSFVEFGGLYTSFVSGNTILFGISAAEAGYCWSNVRRRDRPVRVRRLSGRLAVRERLALERPEPRSSSKRPRSRLAAAMVVDDEAARLAIGPLALAMGLQNHVIAKTRSDNAGATFVTGTLFGFGDSLEPIARRSPHGS